MSIGNAEESVCTYNLSLYCQLQNTLGAVEGKSSGKELWGSLRIGMRFDVILRRHAGGTGIIDSNDANANAEKETITIYRGEWYW